MGASKSKIFKRELTNQNHFLVEEVLQHLVIELLKAWG